jgi:hypothetical protein
VKVKLNVVTARYHFDSACVEIIDLCGWPRMRHRFKAALLPILRSGGRREAKRVHGPIWDPKHSRSTRESWRFPWRRERRRA